MIPDLSSLRATARAFIVAVCVTLAWFTTVGCSQGPLFSTQAAGHAITAHIKGDGTTVETRADGALLGSEFGKVTIERSRMRVEGADWVKIAEDVPVSVGIQRGKITLKAGNVSVSQSVSG